jgi:hypothetical protein
MSSEKKLVSKKASVRSDIKTFTRECLNVRPDTSVEMAAGKKKAGPGWRTCKGDTSNCDEFTGAA